MEVNHIPHAEEEETITSFAVGFGYSYTTSRHSGIKDLHLKDIFILYCYPEKIKFKENKHFLGSEMLPHPQLASWCYYF